jgi:dolichyl-phosphate beta-glucosyltransferase
VVPELFGQPFSSRWVFDVEMLARLRNNVGRDRMLVDVLEFPLWTWHGVDGSKMRLSAMLRAPLELWAIARRYN